MAKGDRTKWQRGKGEMGFGVTWRDRSADPLSDSFTQAVTEPVRRDHEELLERLLSVPCHFEVRVRAVEAVRLQFGKGRFRTVDLEKAPS